MGARGSRVSDDTYRNLISEASQPSEAAAVWGVRRVAGIEYCVLIDSRDHDSVAAVITATATPSPITLGTLGPHIL